MKVWYVKSQNISAGWQLGTVAYPGIVSARGGGGVTRILSGGCSTNSVDDREQRERGSGAGSPQSGVPLNLQMNATHILIILLRIYIPRNYEFGSALAKLRNFGGGVLSPKPPSLDKGIHRVFVK
jgi:hypothetical protein